MSNFVQLLNFSIIIYSVCQVDGSGDCGDDMLKELYPDDDIPDDLIGFLDDKVYFSLPEKKWSRSDFTLSYFRP